MSVIQDRCWNDERWLIRQDNPSSSQISRWIVFLAVSVLLHIAILRWIDIPSESHSNDAASSAKLTVNFSSGLPVQTIPGSQVELIKRQPAIENTKKKLDNEPKADNKKVVEKDVIAPGKVITKQKLIGENTNKKSRARMLIDSAYRQIPGIARDLDDNSSSGSTSEIFDPIFRKKLNLSRQKKRQQEKREGIKSDEIVEMGENSEGYKIIRKNGECWRIPPPSTGLDDLETPIWMPDPGCSQTKKKLFSINE